MVVFIELYPFMPLFSMTFTFFKVTTASDSLTGGTVLNSYWIEFKQCKILKHVHMIKSVALIVTLAHTES